MRHKPATPSGPFQALLPVLLCSALCLAHASPARAQAVFFVNNASASCSPSGPGSSTAPYCTISDALAAHHAPGTTIRVLPGIYREQVSIPASGLAGSPLVLEAHGTASQPVVLEEADDFSGTARWAPQPGNEFLAAEVTWAPVQVFVDGARLDSTAAAPGSLPANSFSFISGSGLYVNLGGDNPGAHDIEVGHRLFGVSSTARSFVEIRGFTVRHAESRGIQLAGASSDVSIVGNVVSLSGHAGIQINGGTNFTVRANTTFDNNDHGIALLTGTTGSAIEDNDSFRNAFPTARQSNGIYMFGAPANRVERNRLHDNQDSGLHMQSGANDNLSIQNLSWNNGDHGFDQLGATGIQHVGDVAFNNFRNGFELEGNSTGSSLHNCIAIENGLTTNESDLAVDATSQSGFDSDDNLFWNSGPQPPFRFGVTRYATVTEFRAATGRDTRTLQADPLFNDASHGDFELKAGSPAIDNANSGVANWPASDALGRARRDDPGMPNNGLGPVSFADRGALEFQAASQVNQPPVARLSVSPTSGTAPLAVTANASASSDADGTIASYRFDFGDGTIVGPQAGATATHTFAAGTWTMSVVVTDDKGATATATATLTASAPANQAPVARLTLTPSSGTAPLAVTANASASSDADGTIASYRFDFGDSTGVGPQPGATATHTFGAGTWTVTVRVTDDKGATGTATATVTVAPASGNQLPVARLSVTPSSGTAPLDVRANAAASSDADGTIASYRFDFGDGTGVGPQPSPNARHTFAAGTWTVRVVATDNKGGTDTTSATITAGPPGADQAPVARLTLTPTSGTAPLDVHASANTSSDADGKIASYRFDFSDGTTTGPKPDPNARHTFAAGTWTVRVVVTDDKGAKDTTSATVTVAAPAANQAPVAALVLLPGTGIAPLQVAASGATSSDVDGSIVSYRFDFGDGTVVGPLALPTAAHVYAAGSWTARLTVTDDRGASSTASVAVQVSGLPLITSGPAAPAPDPTPTVAPLPQGGAPRVRPDPVSSAARIEFAQPVAGEVSAHIFDVEGRIVRTLAERVWTPAGTGGFTLDARDARGAPLRNGIYFVSLESSAGRRTSRFVVAR